MEFTWSNTVSAVFTPMLSKLCVHWQDTVPEYQWQGERSHQVSSRSNCNGGRDHCPSLITPSRRPPAFQVGRELLEAQDGAWAGGLTEPTTKRALKKPGGLYNEAEDGALVLSPMTLLQGSDILNASSLSACTHSEWVFFPVTDQHVF